LLDSFQLIPDSAAEFWLKPAFLGEPLLVSPDEAIEISMYGFEARIFEIMPEGEIPNDVH
ncbi:hypothetical protein KAH55_04170, partial [bacterium]|nr:hypothetical protein [bacterium]